MWHALDPTPEFLKGSGAKFCQEWNGKVSSRSPVLNCAGSGFVLKYWFVLKYCWFEFADGASELLMQNNALYRSTFPNTSWPAKKFLHGGITRYLWRPRLWLQHEGGGCTAHKQAFWWCLFVFGLCCCPPWLKQSLCNDSFRSYRILPHARAQPSLWAVRWRSHSKRR